jgi:hypothetical protein
MILGSGDIASVLIDRPDRLYFCSGVSNSSETRESEYLREIVLLQEQDKSKHLVYFSSLSIFYSDSRYAKHKRLMEDLVNLNFAHYTIMRMGNIIWGNNPHTLINFIRNKIRNRESFEIQDVYRYVVDKEEFLHWVDLIPPWNAEINITGRRMKVRDIVKEFCYPWRSLDAIIEHNNSFSQL